MQKSTVDVEEVQSRLQELLNRIIGGEHVILESDKKPVAEICPIKERIAGLHSGSAWMSPDFDEPLPDEFWTEGK
jgi:antitoxin (DNA-binding transcriptional repressor) of toxin-antitoxin stability system